MAQDEQDYEMMPEEEEEEEGQQEPQAPHTFQSKPRSKMEADAEFLDTIDQTASITDLHRSNLLRLQTVELLEQCQLELSVQEQHVKWAVSAHEYVTAVTSLIENMPTETIRHEKKSPFSLRSDKKKHASVDLQTLKVEPCGCYHAGIGMTTPAGNANVLPTLDLVVKLPNAMFDAKDYLRHRYFDVRDCNSQLDFVQQTTFASCDALA